MLILDISVFFLHVNLIYIISLYQLSRQNFSKFHVSFQIMNTLIWGDPNLLKIKSSYNLSKEAKWSYEWK